MTDPVAYALAIDAMTHQGPADPSRISTATCLQLFMPGVNPLTVATDFAGATAGVATTLATYPHVPSEPPLACYVTVGCPQGAAAPAKAKSGKCKKRKHHRCKKRKKKHRARR
jgi:hypothetical protein